jgi:mersacidin/lichenicidin family type 2 lantibiotic
MDAVRVWKDPEYRETLSAEELASVPAHPAGLTLLSTDDFEQVGGAITAPTQPLFTNLCCFTIGNGTICTGLFCHVAI